MSYILAALKKSELEREQLETAASSEKASMPTDSVSTTHLASAASVNLASRSLVISYALAVIALSSLFAYLLVKPEAELQASPQPTELLVAIEAPAAVKVEEMKIEEVKVTKAEAQVDTIIEVEAKAEIEPKAEVIGIEQASDSLLDQMPNLEITSHIYSSQATRRSIVVNGERLAEGDFVAGQIQVKEITHQGMVLKVKDSLLAVNRSRGWNR
jgi:hypothetical protein